MVRGFLQASVLAAFASSACMAAGVVLDTTVNSTLLNNISAQNAPLFTLRTHSNGNLGGAGFAWSLANPGAALSTSWNLQTAVENPPRQGYSVQSASITLMVSGVPGAASVSAGSYTSPFHGGISFVQMYMPQVTAAAGGLTATIAGGSGSSKVTATAPVGTTIDLLSNGFGSLLAAGAGLTVTLNMTDTLSVPNINIAANGSYYSRDSYCRGTCTEQIVLRDSRTVSVTQHFTMDYSPAPEPVTLVLVGAGLILAGWVGRRERSRRG